MLVASSLRDSTGENNDNQDTTDDIIHMDDISNFSTERLLDSIDFDGLFAELDDDDSDHMLPDLKILGDYLIDETIGDERGLSSDEGGLDGNENDVASASGSGQGQDTSSICSLGEEVVDKAGEVIDVNIKDGKKGQFGKSNKSATPAGNKAGRSNTRCSDGKRKVKVDWTPDLHKRFVQAVEQLGEKAVPSRILEVMGAEGLTRHNIASHLQKYRSHRKHLIAREAEAASWNKSRHIGGIGKRVASPWLVPTSSIGFPHMPSMLPQHVHHSFIRPLHVWGHPSAGNHAQTASNMWSKHVVPHHLRPPHLQPQPVWAPPLRPLTYGPSQGMPCFPLPSQGFVAASVSGIPHHALYKNTPNAAAGHMPSPRWSTPSNERIDAALEDVLSKPWLPLPIGLKPPAIDNVVGELQCQGVPQIPPS